MNPDTKLFEPVTPETPQDWKRFSVGDTFTLNGVEFSIHRINKKGMVVRPVGQQEEPETKVPSAPLSRGLRAKKRGKK